ncbi:MAG: PhoU domain-containing protein [Thermoproteus sp. AZ2]|jgi:phosphate uptake regulator|uniref:PhoU domain-containing protein n=1 Tax=Thermoproteus sp. AZ2 TaxID=1609232 RepID=A0ACC6UZN4_9CREN|nr:MAG: transcriptional regulator [Thermoproteus sp. AZ2]
MEIRKLIRIGERSYGITLPREWVEQNQLKVGSPIKILIESNKVLILPAAAEKAPTAAKIKEEDVEKALRDVIAYYIEGADEIQIESSQISTLVTRIEGKLPGVVALETGGRLSLRIVTKEDVNIDEIVRSMYTTVMAMFHLFFEFLRGPNGESAQELLRMDDQLDRLYFLSLRTIKKNIYQDPQGYVDYAIVVKNLEHVGDALDRATSYLLRNKIPCLSGVLEVFQSLQKYAESAAKAFLENRAEAALSAILNREPLLREVAEKLSPCEGAAPVMHEAMLVTALVADMAEAAYSKYVRKISTWTGS